MNEAVQVKALLPRAGEAAAASDSPTANLSQILDEQRSTILHLRVAAICVAVTFCDGFGVQAINYAGPSLRDALRLTPGELGAIFSASLAGMTLGSFGIGSISDRLGRRAPLILLTVAFALLTASVSLATTFWQVLVLRFLDGLALGSALPNAYVLAAEYSPGRFRRLTIGLVMLGYTVGGAAAGALATSLIPQYGWGSLFMFGGVAGIVTAAAVFLWVPDSLHMLVGKASLHAKAAKILARISPDLSIGSLDALAEPRPKHAGAALSIIFGAQVRRTTICLWVISFVMMMAALLFLSWTPIVLKDAGFPLAQAIGVTVAFTIGSMVMSVGAGWLTDRYNPPLVLAACAGVGCCGLALMGLNFGTVTTQFLISFITGAGLGGALAGMNALATTAYPPSVRVTASGWAIGIGRLGAVCGPLIGARWINAQMRGTDLFFVAMMLSAIGATASLLMLKRLSPHHDDDARL